MRTMRFTALTLAGLALLGCSSNCAPVSGGVLVTVQGVSSCEVVTVSATDGTHEYAFEATGSAPTDGGFACEFQGLKGHPGTFTLQVHVSGQLTATKSVTLQKLDECNVSAQMVTIDSPPA